MATEVLRACRGGLSLAALEGDGVAKRSSMARHCVERGRLSVRGLDSWNGEVGSVRFARVETIRGPSTRAYALALLESDDSPLPPQVEMELVDGQWWFRDFRADVHQVFDARAATVAEATQRYQTAKTLVGAELLAELRGLAANACACTRLACTDDAIAKFTQLAREYEQQYPERAASLRLLAQTLSMEQSQCRIGLRESVEP